MISAVKKGKVGTLDGSMLREGGAGGGGQEKLSENQYLSKDLKEVKEEAVQTSEGVASQSEGMAGAETLR